MSCLIIDSVVLVLVRRRTYIAMTKTDFNCEALAQAVNLSIDWNG